LRVLLDTCAVSELKKPKPDPAVVAAISAIPSADLFLSVLSAGEIAKGIELLPDGKRKRELKAWLLELERDYADRLLPVDRETAHIWGEITARPQKRGQTLAAIDGLLAATALRHGLHLMTRNEADFAGTGALIMNPWMIP
jgi:hypothetical protein